MKIKDYVNNICVNAKLSSQEISCLTEGEKNLILLSANYIQLKVPIHHLMIIHSIKLINSNAFLTIIDVSLNQT